MAQNPLSSGPILHNLFTEAATAVQGYASGMLVTDNPKPTDSQLLELYGLYKVATVGPCNEPQPGMFNIKAKAKWNAWKEKSAMSENDAMMQYITQVATLYNWRPPQLDELVQNKAPSGGFMVAVSRPHIPKEETFEDVDTPFGWVKDDETSKIQSWIHGGKADLNLRDSDGLTLLHWAVDRGRKEMCEILLRGGANPELKDEDDQTPLDYAITCEHDEIIKLLQNHVKK